MKLHHIETTTGVGTLQMWRASVDLGQVTLLVGRNATGKSRILASIRSLSQLLTKRRAYANAQYDVTFGGPVPARYRLEIKDSIVKSEELSISGDVVVKRHEDGTGTIAATDAKEGELKFQIPPSELAVAIKRDLIQHPFLEPLHKWAGSLRFYRFNEFPRETLGVWGENSETVPDVSDFEQSLNVLFYGQKKFGNKFEQAIIRDMAEIGYPIDKIGLKTPQAVRIVGAGMAPMGLFVREKDLRGVTEQLEMSDGMFRALALIIHTAYSEIASVPSCVVVDDIGEGLDYERSTALINLLMKRAAKNAIQLLMSTNDRFAMNAVPLDAWCGLRRTQDGVETISPKTHGKQFQDFGLTGLNNFDFFKTDFFSNVGSA